MTSHPFHVVSMVSEVDRWKGSKVSKPLDDSIKAYMKELFRSYVKSAAKGDFGFLDDSPDEPSERVGTVAPCVGLEGMDQCSDFSPVREYETEPPYPSCPPPAQAPRPKRGRLSENQIQKYIDARCWINGIFLDSMDTEYLLNCKNFALTKYHEKWYWPKFLSLVREEIQRRNQLIGPIRCYPGTENIPRRGGQGSCVLIQDYESPY